MTQPHLTLVDCADAIVDDAARTRVRPHERECLVCFVTRLVADLGCDTTLRFAGCYRDAVAPRATALERRLQSVGGFCDCELLVNGFQVDRRLWKPGREVHLDGDLEERGPEPPDSVPACFGVRRGSTRPCGIWERRRWGW